MSRHIFDVSERASRAQAARQLRELADQIDRGTIDMAYGDYDAPTPVNEPLRIVLDLTRHRHHFELELNARWPDAAAG